MQSKKLRAWAPTSSPVTFFANFSSFLSAAGTRFDLAAVAGLHPALVADEPHGTSAQPSDPARTIAERRFEKIEHQLHAVRVMGRDVSGGRLEFDRQSCRRLCSPIGKGRRYAHPSRAAYSAGLEIVIAAPAAGYVLAVVWPPWRRPQPQVPIDHVARRRRLGRAARQLSSCGV